MLPSQVRAEDVLEDMQLTLWPAEAMPPRCRPGWRMADEGTKRTLYLDDNLSCEIATAAMPRWSGTVVLENLRYHYKLTIQFARRDLISRPCRIFT
jgi:hypothetical protein